MQKKELSMKKTIDDKTRYYLADDAGAPVEPVLMYLKFICRLCKEYFVDALHPSEALILWQDFTGI